MEFKSNILATGTITGSNLSGTNTGDQDLSGYLLTTGKAADSNLLDGINSTCFLRSDANDETNSGIKTWFGGALDSGSYARIQINGFQRTGNIYLHSGGNAPDNVRNSDYLNNISGDLHWNKNAVGNGKIWTSLNDGSGSGLDADLLDGQHASAFQPAGTYNTIIGTDSDINTSGSTIIDNIYVTDGVITSMGTRTLTASDIGAAANSHNHDDRYYTETESDGRFVNVTGDTMTGDLALGSNNVDFKTNGNSASPNFFGHRSAIDLDTRFTAQEGGWSYTTFDSTSNNIPTSGLHNANGLLSFNTHVGNYGHQIAMTTNTKKIYFRSRNNTAWGDWYEFYHEGHKPTASEIGAQPAGNYFTDGDTVLNMANNDGLVYNDTNNLMYIKADGTDYQIIDVRGGTMSGTLNMGANTLTGNNFNITGVNQITINDPGEGIVWAGGSSGNITLATVDDSSDNILRLSGTGASLQVGTNTVWHSGNDGSGSGLDADTLDGQHASAFQLALTNPVTGTGTTNYLSKFTGSTTLGNSLVYDNGTNVGIGTTSPGSKLEVVGDTSSALLTLKSSNGGANDSFMRFYDESSGPSYSVGLDSSDSKFKIAYDADGDSLTTGTKLVMDTSGNVGIGTTSPLNPLSIESSSSPLIKIRNTTNGGGAAIEFNDNSASASSQNGRIKYVHSDSASQGGGSTFVLEGENDQTLQLLNNGRVVVQKTGSATEVGYGFYNDVGTGMYSPSANTVALATGGNNRLHINSSGNVGIGTTSPVKKLHVKETSGTFEAAIFETNSGGSFIRNIDSTGSVETGIQGGKWSARTSNTQRLVIDSLGNVGIGTISPGVKLDVNGTIKTNAIFRGDTLNNSANTHNIIYRSGTSTFIAGGDKLVVQDGGNVGIGTTSPNNKLDVVSSDWVQASFRSTGSGYAPASILLEAGDSSSRGQGVYNYNSPSKHSWFSGVPYSTSSDDWVIAHKLETTAFNPDVAQMSNALLSVKANGNVGIGTTAPSQKLHVAGNMRLQNQLYDSTNSAGSNGQVLTKTSGGTIWADNKGLTPITPGGITATIVGETIEIAFNQSTTSNIDYYQVWSSDDGGDYGIIGQIAPADFSTTMTVVDTTFVTGGTMSYRVYAVKSGVYSQAGTVSKAYTVSALDVTNMTVVNLNTAYYVQYEKPISRFIDHIEIWMDSQTTQAALNRSNATLVYSGQNTSYMRSVGTSSNFHQFWVEVVTS